MVEILKIIRSAGIINTEVVHALALGLSNCGRTRELGEHPRSYRRSASPRVTQILLSCFPNFARNSIDARNEASTFLKNPIQGFFKKYVFLKTCILQ